MKQAAKAIASADAQDGLASRDRGWLRDGRALLKGAVRPVLVVVAGVGAQHPLEMPWPEDEHPIEALATHAAHPPLRVRLRPRRSYWGADDFDAFGAEDLVEGGGELAVPV